MSVKKISKKGNVLTIDIGGTNVKACVLDDKGKIITDYVSKPTPKNAGPKEIISTIEKLTANVSNFEKISVGFPGYVRSGIVQTAPNLGENKWSNVDLADQISALFDKPVRLVNDADLQGLGIVKGFLTDEKSDEIFWFIQNEPWEQRYTQLVMILTNSQCFICW